MFVWNWNDFVSSGFRFLLPVAPCMCPLQCVIFRYYFSLHFLFFGVAYGPGQELLQHSRLVMEQQSMQIYCFSPHSLTTSPSPSRRIYGWCMRLSSVESFLGYSFRVFCFWGMLNGICLSTFILICIKKSRNEQTEHLKILINLISSSVVVCWWKERVYCLCFVVLMCVGWRTSASGDFIIYNEKPAANIYQSKEQASKTFHLKIHYSVYWLRLIHSSGSSDSVYAHLVIHFHLLMVYEYNISKKQPINNIII